MRRFRGLIPDVALGLLLLVCGCRSPWVQCTIVNHESAPVSLVEVNYPGGSFGVQTIAAGGGYPPRFPRLGTATVRIDSPPAARRGGKVARVKIGCFFSAGFLGN